MRSTSWSRSSPAKNSITRNGTPSSTSTPKFEHLHDVLGIDGAAAFASRTKRPITSGTAPRFVASDDLQRHPPTGAAVNRLIDGPHATFAQ